MQSKKTLLFIIGLILVIFVLLSILANQLCHPTQNNAVVNAVSEAISSSQPLSPNSAPDPLSWGPIFQQLINFLSKACPR